jgi:exopolysaccharide biosynthesis predicted pyruvyltransferase EpsI
LTLTLERAAIAREHDLIVLCDVPKAVAARAEVYAKGRQLHQLVHRDSNTVGIEARLDRAKALLNLYAQAACVVTTRLHCALPCLAMGTPVLLIDMAADSYRFTGLIDLLHHCSVAEFVSGELGYDLADPPQNPTGHLLLRKALVERVIAFTKETTPSLPRSL